MPTAVRVFSVCQVRRRQTKHYSSLIVSSFVISIEPSLALPPTATALVIVVFLATTNSAYRAHRSEVPFEGFESVVLEDGGDLSPIAARL